MSGYGDPPTHTRFQPGVSGNPSGRKRDAHITSLLSQPVAITYNGKTIEVEPFKARLLVNLDKALKGDLKSLSYLLKLFREQEVTPARRAQQGSIVRVRGILPLELRNQLVRRKNGRPMTLEQMDRIRRDFFAAADELSQIREEVGCYTSNQEILNWR